MKQTIQINVDIPENYTLVETEWLNNLMKQTLPTYWTMKDLRKDTRMSDYSIKNTFWKDLNFRKNLKESGLKVQVAVKSILFQQKR